MTDILFKMWELVLFFLAGFGTVVLFFVVTLLVVELLKELRR